MKLLPCPFCGGSAILATGTSSGQGGGKVAWVECANCGCSTQQVEEWNNDCELEAVELWNKRKGE